MDWRNVLLSMLETFTLFIENIHIEAKTSMTQRVLSEFPKLLFEKLRELYSIIFFERLVLM